jgi:hypothetical protein
VSKPTATKEPAMTPCYCHFALCTLVALAGWNFCSEEHALLEALRRMVASHGADRAVDSPAFSVRPPAATA